MRVAVLHLDLRNSETTKDPNAGLEEAVSLTAALPDLTIVHSEVVTLRTVKAGTLLGAGKLDDLSALIEDQEIGLVIIDGVVSPIQQRNLERQLKVKILDRTGLILEIFGERAQTREGVLQVELAALQYARSRLVRSWTHLERQRGGLGFVGGAGETQIEADRRAIDDAIVRLKRQLEKVVKTRKLHRAARKKVPFPIVALVGYTNAGKSTLFNRLTGAKVLEKDMLFATLDPTMRLVELPDGQRVILSDTVGFISDLPTQLIAAFRATLEEVLDADLILHIRDIAHRDTEAQAENVRQILAELEVEEAVQDNSLEVWNKADLLGDEDRRSAQNTVDRSDNILLVSALKEAGFEALLAAIDTRLRGRVFEETVRLGFAEGARRAWLYGHNLVQNEVSSDSFVELSVRWNEKQKQQFATIESK
ncbi:MAG: GTPase HflX [Pseudomonadota bacterium]